jgi:hypothetical protein
MPKQPAMKAGSAGGVFLCDLWPGLIAPEDFFCAHGMVSCPTIHIQESNPRSLYGSGLPGFAYLSVHCRCGEYPLAQCSSSYTKRERRGK